MSAWPTSSDRLDHTLIAKHLDASHPPEKVRSLLDEAYFEQIDDWLADSDREDCSAEHYFRESYRTPWTSSELPTLSESWIEEQSDSLNELYKIHDCRGFYLPESKLLTAEQLPFVSPGSFSRDQIWTCALALAMRSMYFTGNDQSELAWRDAKTCLALSSLQHCHDHEDVKCRILVRRLALHCCVAIVTESECDDATLSGMSSYIASLPDARLLLEDALEYQRLSSLTMAARLSTRRFGAEEDAEIGVMDYLSNKGVLDLGYDEQSARAAIQRWFDTLGNSILEKQFSIIESSENALEIADSIPKPYSEPISSEEYQEMSREERGKAIGGLIVGFCDASALAFSKPILNGMRVHEQLVLIAIELERYRSAHGTYPVTLENLSVARGHIVDPITKKPMIYRLMDDGYLLYSVYLNQIDDGGDGGDPTLGQIVDGEWVLGRHDIDIGEDLVIRVPIAPFQECSRRGE